MGKREFSRSVAIVLAGVALLLLSACRTVRETSTTDHKLSERLERIDSLVRQTIVTRQDSSWRESVLRQFESIRQHTDTSHTVVTDTAGRVLKETLIIRERTETTSETDRMEREVMLHRMAVLDSVVTAQSALIERMDSTVHAERTTVEVAAPLTWWQSFRLTLANILLCAAGIVAAGWVVKRKLKR